MPSNYFSVIPQGLYSQELGFSSSITTISTTDTEMIGMSWTPTSGTYLVIFSAWFTHSNGNATVTFSIYYGSIQNSGSIRTCTPFEGAIGSANNGKSFGTNAIVTVNGSQSISLQWHTSTGTVTAHNGNLDIIKIG